MKKSHFIIYSSIFYTIIITLTLFLEYQNPTKDLVTMNYSYLLKPFFIGAFIILLLTNFVKVLKDLRPINRILLMLFGIIYFGSSYLITFI